MRELKAVITRNSRGLGQLVQSPVGVEKVTAISG
jgi:hypothetical protein